MENVKKNIPEKNINKMSIFQTTSVVMCFSALNQREVGLLRL